MQTYTQPRLEHPFPINNSCALYTFLFLTLLSLTSCSGSDSDATSTTHENPISGVTTIIYDDFDTVYPVLFQLDDTTQNASTKIEFLDNSAIVEVTSQDTNRQAMRFLHPGTLDNSYAQLAVMPASDIRGAARVQAQINLGVYNDRADVGYNERHGNVGFFIGLNFIEESTENTPSFYFGAYRHNDSSSVLVDPHPILDGESLRSFQELAPELNISYRLGISVDRANQTVTFSVDDNSLTFSLPTPLYETYHSWTAFSTVVDGGPGTASVAIGGVEVDGKSSDFSNPEKLFRYDTREADRPKLAQYSVNNGELKLQSNSMGGTERMGMRLTNVDSTYLGAKIRMSNESIANNGGLARARVGGYYYNAVNTPQFDDLTGMVFAASELVLQENGGMNARYCAWQSLNSDFSESVSLTNSDNSCSIFSITPVPEQDYAMATWLDIPNRKLLFSIDDEVQEVAIQTPINRGDALTLRLSSRADGDGTRSTMYADDLKVAAQ